MAKHNVNENQGRPQYRLYEKIKKKSFTENKIILENYHEAFKYLEKRIKKIQQSMEIKLENWLKAIVMNELIEELEMETLDHLNEYLQIDH